MPSQRNIHSLAEIVHSLNDSKAVIFTQYSGLSVADQTSLRSEASKNGGSFMVAKNNLLRRALKEKSKDLAEGVDTILNGQTAVFFGTDPVSASKTITKFAEDHEQLQIKSAIFEDKIATIADIKAYSKLPSREQLLASLLAQLQAPAQALVRQLSAPIQNFVYGLDALRIKLSTSN